MDYYVLQANEYNKSIINNNNYNGDDGEVVRDDED